MSTQLKNRSFHTSFLQRQCFERVYKTEVMNGSYFRYNTQGEKEEADQAGTHR